MLAEHRREDFNEQSCVHAIKECVNIFKKGAIYINQGLHKFPIDSPAHEAQVFHSLNYVESLGHVVRWGCLRFPEDKTDSQFIQEEAHQDFKDLMNGQGNYVNIIPSPEYADFLKALQAPDISLDYVARTAKDFI